MKITKALILTFIIAIPYFTIAQNWNVRKYEFYYGLGASNFMGDVGAPPDPNKQIWVNFFNTIGVVGNTGLRYNFAERQHARANLVLGQLFAKEPVGDENTWQTGRKMNSFITEVSCMYEFEIFKEKTKRTVYRQLGQSAFKNFSLPTYLFIGIGGTFSLGKYSSLADGGKNLESKLFTNLAFVVPIGIGFKYRINNLTYMNLEAGYRFSTSDGIDYWNGKEHANGKFGTYPDQYQFITINVIHKLRANRNGLPRFKKR